MKKFIIPWNKGKKLSAKHRENLSKSHKGHTPWNKGLKGYSTSRKGQSLSEEHKNKLSEAKKENWSNQDYRCRMAATHLGKKQSKETIEKRIKRGKDHYATGKTRPNISGEKHYNWKGGISNGRKNNPAYNCCEWKLIRKEVLTRYSFKCQRCGAEGTLDVHHIIPFRIVKEHKIENLISLCRSCHITVERNETDNIADTAFS